MKRLLLIDDDEVDRRLIIRALKQIDDNIKVIEIERGEEGHRKLKELWPVMTVLDIRMPEMDGFEVLSAIRSDEECANHPILMLSGSDDPEDMRRARELGATDYRVKPSTTDGYRSLAREIHSAWLN